jgi:hypothetical protein
VVPDIHIMLSFHTLRAKWIPSSTNDKEYSICPVVTCRTGNKQEPLRDVLGKLYVRLMLFETVSIQSILLLSCMIGMSLLCWKSHVDNN